MRKIRIRVNKTKVNDLKLKKIRIRVNKTKIKSLKLKTNSKILSGKLATVILVIWLLIAGFAFSINYFGTNAYFSDIETINDCSFTAKVSDNPWSYPDCPPDNPILIAPENNTEGMHLNPVLSVHVTDPNGDMMDVSFYDASNNNLIDIYTNVESGSNVSVIWDGLDYGITYEWHVIAEDYEGPTQSDTWAFTTNYPPDIPSLTFPANDSADVVLSPTLKVKVFDLDGDNMNVSFYDATNNQLIGANDSIADGENASIKWGSLDYSTTYKWYVIVNDSMTETQSPIWRFATQPLPSGGGGGSEDDAATENIPPIAHLPESYTGHVFENIMFDASGTYDPDGSIVNYTWNFGDGNTTTGTNMTVNHTYDVPGTYDVTLSVTDNNGTVSTATTTAIISSILQINSIQSTPPIQKPNSTVNITCNITNTSRLVDVLLNITSPNGSYTEVSIINNNIENTSSYYYNHTYKLLGTYNFYILISDTSVNEEISAIKDFTIKEIISLRVTDVSACPNPQYINGKVNITANVTDDIEIASVFLNITNPDYSTNNISMSGLNGTDTYYYNQTYTLPGIYEYYIWATDIKGNTTTSVSQNFSIADITPPEINSITITPTIQTVNGFVNVTVNVTDNVEVANVFINITNPDNSTSNVSMIHINGTDIYYLNSTYLDYGEYTFFIFAIDAYNNCVKSGLYTFSINDFDPPNIIDHTPTTAYKNDTLTFNASVTDNNIVADVYVEYWNESEVHTNQSMINTNNSFWETTITISCDQETLHYIICGRDMYGNWNHTEIININLL